MPHGLDMQKLDGKLTSVYYKMSILQWLTTEISVQELHDQDDDDGVQLHVYEMYVKMAARLLVSV